MNRRGWLRPLEFVARAVKHALLFWLWWIGLRPFQPVGEELRELRVQNLWLYLGLTIALGALGAGLVAIVRTP